MICPKCGRDFIEPDEVEFIEDIGMCGDCDEYQGDFLRDNVVEEDDA